MSGWIKLHRDIFDSDIWHDVTTFRLFIYLIGQASHKDGMKVGGIELKRGQYIRSYRKLADDLSYKEGRGYKKYSLSTIKNSVNKLVTAERVNVQETELGTLFTIINYSKYQDFEEENGESPNTQIEKVRTNTELTPNEVRTNPEQKQELKNERIKEYITTTTGNPIQLFEKLLCRLSPVQMESLLQWQDDFGDPDIINEAIRIADNRNKRTFAFVEYLLKEWANNNLDSLDRVKAYEQEKFNKIKTKPYQPKPVRREVVPDWFEDRQQLNAEDDEVVNFEEEKKKMQERLKKYKAGR
ncbi:DnaD domain-containing protein [Fervidibacillus albus]|uniref:DnaD domain protein n=1 Tax=Fervidibacillus albus TaxID=2980026 RepID=A0A9E8LWW3_9BACI|nr:DnaD domain protein [Fervidibacillus albus]WAA10820.1 DnaD domain protein [Fervidibacillus albus]